MDGLTLEIVEGNGAGRRAQLTGAVEIGRSADLSIDDPLASRAHARIDPAQGGAVVTDLGSTNGTFVNGQQLTGPTHVRPGDTILIGATLLLLRTSDQVARQPSAAHRVPPPLAVPLRLPDYVAPVLDRPAAAPPPGAGHPLEPLLDRNTKARARLAPLAIFIVVVFAVLIIFSLR